MKPMKLFSILTILLTVFPLNAVSGPQTIVPADLIPGQDSYKDYLKVGHFEQNVRGWSSYADAAGAVPVDCTGGSPTLAISRTTTNPLSGSGSGLLTKDAANRQGEGVSAAFTLDREVSANPRVLRVTGSYEVASGTFQYGSDSQASDIEVYLYDVTASKLVYPSANRLVGDGRVSSEFQPDAASTSFRVCLHQTTTSASAYTLKVDNLRVSTQPRVTGPVVSKTSEYSLVIGAVTTPPTKGTIVDDKAQYHREGEYLVLRYDYYQSAAGSAGSGVYKFPLPAGLSIDLTKAASNLFGFGLNSVGWASSYNGGAGFSGDVYIHDATNLSIRVGNSADALTQVGSGFLSLANTDQRYTFVAKVPISGWSSNQVVSSDQGTRDVTLILQKAGAAQSIPDSTLTKIGFDAPIVDTVGGWNAATNEYTVPETGMYEWSFLGYFDGNATGSTRQAYLTDSSGTILRSANGERTVASASSFTGTATLRLEAGQVVWMTVWQNSGGNLNFGSAEPETVHFSLSKKSSPQQIAASEVVAARYSTASGAAISSTTTTTIDFGTKDFDTHSAVTVGSGWVFAAPISGLYSVSAQISYSSSWNAGEYLQFILNKNGSAYSRSTRYIEAAMTSTEVTRDISDIVPLNRGDTISITVFNENGRALTAEASKNFISINRIGGVQ